MSNGEDEIIRWFAEQSRISARDFPIGIGDDMAEVRLSEEASVLITTDMLLDGVHFNLQKASLEEVGYKAMAVSLSDCAAMASRPIAAVVSVGLPRGFGGEELKRLHSGIVSAGEKYGCVLIGGDITKWRNEEGIAVSVAMLSRAESGRPVKRSGAKAGDVICVTGELGASNLGRHLKFEPRVFEAIKIAEMVKVNSMIDISDGLSSDLSRICRQSEVGAVIEAERLPISDPARESADPLNAALNYGEDFELLFTLGESQSRRLLKEWSGAVAVTAIGAITGSGRVQIKMPGGRIRDLEAKGYDHLR
jgi:thiamine-monophosphate kinase